MQAIQPRTIGTGPASGIFGVKESGTENRATVPMLLRKLRPLLRCPQCHAALGIAGSELHCDAGHAFPVEDRIPRLARYAMAEGRNPGRIDVPTSLDYQARYRQYEAARRYNEAYRDKPTKRWSTVRELALLGRLFDSQPHCRTLLDIPCGGGRLSEAIASATTTLIEADTGLGQLLYAREQSPVRSSRLWMTASAFHIPFADESIDAVVCIRLCHHLPTQAEREHLLAELLRVARRYVVMTFFDYHSPKNLLRRLRAPFNNKPPKLTMTRQRVAEVAAAHGAKLVTAPALAWQSSGHRYALLVKSEPG
ncbi:MAG: class I SAM-dependent methyltransferase [Woeseiaceae bacterium]|nr:class I SAM-dependent methyltransferase [Woeseiaceae bacterium]